MKYLFYIFLFLIIISCSNPASNDPQPESYNGIWWVSIDNQDLYHTWNLTYSKTNKSMTLELSDSTSKIYYGDFTDKTFNGKTVPDKNGVFVSMTLNFESVTKFSGEHIHWNESISGGYLLKLSLRGEKR